MFNPRGYNLEFRPKSYWDFQDPISGILCNIKGSRRRAFIRDVLAATGDRREQLLRLGSIDSALYEESLFPSLTDEMSRMGPSYMGGEYLPNTLRGEIEIARITLASVTRDVYSIRARQQKRKFIYRMVDEYSRIWTLKRRSSTRPLSLGELIHLIDNSELEGKNAGGDQIGWLLSFQEGYPQEISEFITVSSEIYADLEPYYVAKTWAWVEERCADKNASLEETVEILLEEYRGREAEMPRAIGDLARQNGNAPPYEIDERVLGYMTISPHTLYLGRVKWWEYTEDEKVIFCTICKTKVSNYYLGIDRHVHEFHTEDQI